jgi:hypothetical protein
MLRTALQLWDTLRRQRRVTRPRVLTGSNGSKGGLAIPGQSKMLTALGWLGHYSLQSFGNTSTAGEDLEVESQRLRER